MGWQDAGVALIVLGAAIFLARKVFARPPKKPAGSLVSLMHLNNTRGCHSARGDFRPGLRWPGLKPRPSSYPEPRPSDYPGVTA